MKQRQDVTTSYAWDNNGNLIKKTSPEGEISYSWSSSNKLIAIDDQVNRRQVSYQYDGQDNRIGKVTKQNGQTIETQYLVDSERPYSEVVLERTRVDQGAWSETLYVHTPEGLGDLLTQDQTGQVNHLYQDAQGSTRLVTDQQGSTQSIIDYNAFGNALLSSKPDSTIKHRYVGEYLDQDSGFYHLRARDYDPKIGRFVSRDSFEGVRNNPITLNPYLYAHAESVNIIDPSGYMGLIDINVSMMNSLQTVGTRMAYFMNLYDKVQAVSGFIELISGTNSIMGVIQGLSASDFGINGHPSSESFDYQEAIQSFTFNLPRAICTGIGDWASGYSKTKRQGTKLKGFLIYMPMFKTQIENTQKTIPTGAKIRFGNEKVPIKLVFGAEKKGARGQLFGLGMQMKNLRQLIRMDHHTPAPDHGGKKGLKPKELGYWIDGDFHYHIMQWH
ncbi:RHS repeat domain-containing protein [Snodgrassella sp. M0351]|uniref:RHS repeat domain-containing protein n=1 Tax=Snodgrassella sp. M0351 TaxID=2751012 RepID=UPI0018DBC751|nr:RHS repeat-associated core domain-containing protein [Snodgrassella sp. M0351]